MKKALFYTVIMLAIQCGLGSAVLLIWALVTGQKPDVTNNSMIVVTTVVDLLLMVLFLALKWAEVSPRWIRTRPWAVLCWCVLASLGLLLPSIWLQELMPELPNVAEEALVGLVSSPWGYVAIGIMAPLAEELVFRGAVLRALLQWRPDNHWLGIAVSAALFALVHMNPAQMPHAFLIGLLLGWMYYRTGSIIPGMVYHWVNNSVVFAAGHIMLSVGWDVDNMKLADLFGSQTTVLMAVGCSLLIFLPSLFQLHLRLKK